MESDGRETNHSGKQLKSICYAGTELLSCFLNLCCFNLLSPLSLFLSGQKYDYGATSKVSLTICYSFWVLNKIPFLRYIYNTRNHKYINKKIMIEKKWRNYSWLFLAGGHIWQSYIICKTIFPIFSLDSILLWASWISSMVKTESTIVLSVPFANCGTILSENSSTSFFLYCKIIKKYSEAP